MSSSSSPYAHPRETTTLVGTDAQDYRDSPLKPAPLRIPSKTRPSTPKIVTQGIAGSSSRLSLSQQDGHYSATTPVHHAPVRTTASSLAGLVSKFEILDAMTSDSPAEDTDPQEQASASKPKIQERKGWDPLLVAERRKLFEKNHGSESPKKPPTSTPSPRKAKLPVSKSRTARDEAGTGVVSTEPQAQPHTPKKVSISESAEEEHPAIVKPRPDTPMPGRQTRKTPSVAQLRASFEGAGHDSPARTSSIKPAQEHTPSPRKDSSVHRQDWAVKDVTPSRGSQHIIEKRSIGRISHEVTPSHLKPHSSGTGTNRSFALRVTAEGYATTATLMPDSSSAPQRAPHPKIDHRRSTRAQTLKRTSATEETTPNSYYQSSSVVHPSLVHPLLRQTKSMGTGLQEQRTLKHGANAEGTYRTSVPDEGLPPISNRTGSKVAGLRERYDRASVSAPFLPFRRRLASPTTSLVALSAAIGLATFPGDTPSPVDITPTSSRTHHPTIGAADADKKGHHHLSPLRDRISIFESLATPATKGKSSSGGGGSKAATALRRASGGAGAGLRTVAETGSRVWQRLSSSGSSAEKEAGSSSSGDGGGQHVRKKDRKGKGKGKMQKRKQERVAGRGGVGFEPRRNTRPCAPGESTFLVQGTISRVPIGVVMAMGGHQRRQQQQQPGAGDARGAQQPPSLPDLDFEVDGAAADMVGYFAHEFDISFSLAGGGATSSSSGGDATGRSGGEGSSSSNSSSDRDGVVGPVETSSAQYRNPTVVAKSRASPVLSVHSARGTSVARPAIPPRNPARGRRIAHDGESSQQRRAWRPPTPAPARNKYGGFCDNRPVLGPVVGTASPVSEGDGNEDVVVSSAQCGLAHPRPLRGLDVRRFVGYCRETARGRSATRVMGKL